MSSDRMLAAGVVGLGFGAIHARVLGELPDVRLAAVCDADAARLAAVADAPSLHRYTDFATMLREESLDALVIAVPARLHVDVALAAIEAGVAMLIEKPLAPSYDEGKRVVKAAAAANVPLMTGHVERFNAAVQELRRRVHAGEIGRVLHMTARRMGPIVVRKTQDVNVVHDSALHDIDVMRYVLGAEVEHVYAEAQTDLLMPFEDSLSGVLRFADAGASKGAIGTLEVNWLSPRRVRDLSVLGENGLFHLDYAAQTLELHRVEEAAHGATARRQWTANAAVGETDGALKLPVEAREPLKQELGAFVTALREGAPMPVSGADALAALAVADALTEAARTGAVVTPRSGG